MAHKEWAYITTAVPTMNGGLHSLRLASFCGLGWEPSTSRRIPERYRLFKEQPSPKDAGTTFRDSAKGRWMDAASVTMPISGVDPTKTQYCNIFSASIVYKTVFPAFPAGNGNFSEGHPDTLGEVSFLTPPLTPPQYSGISHEQPYRFSGRV